MKILYRLLFYTMLGFASIYAMEGKTYQLGERISTGWLDADQAPKYDEWGHLTNPLGYSWFDDLLDEQGKPTDLMLWHRHFVVRWIPDRKLKLVGVLQDSVLRKPDAEDIKTARDIWKLDVSDFAK